MKNIFRILVLLGAAVFAGCVYEFHPDMERIEGLDMYVLVVEGDIIVGGETVVKLSYAMPLDMKIPHGEDYYLWKASVWVEDEHGNVWNGIQNQETLTEFRIDTRDLDEDGTYRLCISLPNDGDYVSEFRKCLSTPAINEFKYTVPEDSTCVYVEISSHKGGDGTGYYKWSYNEVWHNKPDIMPELDYYTGGLLSYKSQAEREALANCYRSENSTDILVASTENLMEDRIINQRLAAVAASDNRISKVYMMAVTQSLIDAQGYRYWESMKKNTTGTGGLFAPQPSEVRGNIVNVTSENQQVIGYINVSTVSVDTLFIDGRQLGIYDASKCYNSIRYYVTPYWQKAYYEEGLRPVSFMKDENGYDITTEAQWAPVSCVSAEKCVSRPAWWPKED